MSNINPFKVYEKLHAEHPLNLDELELDTIKNDKEWSKEDEVKAAILTIVKNPAAIIDPNLFANVALALFGIPPDFEEYEIVLPEILNSAVALIEKIYQDKGIYPVFSDDIKGFIAVSCLEEGLWFLENSLEQFQDYLNSISEFVYGTKIDEVEVAKCEELWKQYQNSNIDIIPENDNDEFQIKYNKFIKDFTKNYDGLYYKKKEV